MRADRTEAATRQRRVTADSAPLPGRAIPHDALHHAHQIRPAAMLAHADERKIRSRRSVPQLSAKPFGWLAHSNDSTSSGIGDCRGAWA